MKVLITLKILNQKGHEDIKVTPERIQELISQIQRGEVDTLPKGTYLIYNTATQKIIGRQDIEDDQVLVLVPQIAGG